MIKVDNRHIVQKVAKRTYQANKKRNMITILAVILTTFLIVSVVGIGIAYWQMISERQIKMNGMDYDIELSEPTEEQVEIAKGMDRVEYAGVSVKCAILDSANDSKISKMQLYWVDDTCWKEQCLPAFDSMVGNYPVKEDEILVSAEALRNMGITNPKVGMDIKGTYTSLSAEPSAGNSANYTFQLSGFYTDFTGKARGYVSEAFYQMTGAKQTDFTQGTLKITLKNPLYSEKSILSMQEEFKLRNKQYLSADYDSIRGFIKTMAVLLGLLVLIFVSGYLFIYNTLYIAVSKDIRYYGQLKTIGMTSVQIKKVIYKQALWNGCVGIPLGLLVGYLVSLKVIPTVLQITNSDMAKTASFGYYPLLFLVAAVFSSITIFVSSKKPASMAGNCSPIEAIRFTEGRAKANRSEDGLRTMARRNIFRDKKKAVFVLGSFIISMTIFFTINVVIRENDSKTVLNEIYSYDMRLVNETVPEDTKQLITKKNVNQIKDLDGVEGIRTVYSAYIDVPYQEDVFGDFYKELYQSRYSPGDYEEDISMYKKNEDAYGVFNSKIIGIDAAELELLLEHTGLDIDTKKFHDGDIALTSDFIGIRPEDAVGKTVSFSMKSTDREQSTKIVGIVEDPSEFASGYTPVIIVSEKWYKKLIADPIIELLNVDYTFGFDKKTEEQVKNIISESQGVSTYSKLDRYNDMRGNERQIKVLGNGIGVIIAFLAILNYINMMVSGVQNRKKEFATLESIGMTAKQIRIVLVKEGLGYAAISIFISLLAGIPVSYIVFQSMNTYGIAYGIPILSNLILFGAITLVCVLVPPVIYNISNKGTVLEQLRESDE